MLKQVNLYMEESRLQTAEWRARLSANLEQEGIALSVLTEEEWDRECAGFSVSGHREGEEGTLFVTDCEKKAAWLAAKGYPVLGCLHKSNRDKAFAGVRFLTEPDGLEAEYLERVYRRLTGIPWQILETSRCIVRETVEADVDAFYEIYAEPSITKYMENLFEDKEDELRYTAQYRENMYAFYGFGIWSVLLKETGEVIGRAGFDVRDGYEEPELGFVIGRTWQGRGLAGEVCGAILHYGAAELGFRKVQALVEPGNTVSCLLLDSLGFKAVGKCMENNKKYIRYILETDFIQRPEELQSPLHPYGP